jgi:hypothetical protein
MEQPIIFTPRKEAAPAVELPEQFAHLTPFIQWALPTENERNIMRHKTDMEDIKAFSAAMLENVSAICTYLDGFDLSNYPPKEKALMQMLLSLAEVAPAVEFYNQQAVVDGYDPRRFPATDNFFANPSVQ